MSGIEVASLKAVIALSDELTPELKKAKENLNGFGDKLKSISADAMKMGGALTAGLSMPILGFFAAAVKSASDSRDVLAQFDATLNSTAASADATARAQNKYNAALKGAEISGHMAREAYIDLAISMEETTRFSKDAVMGGESLLLTFTGIGKDVFPEATQTMLDMSQALGQDVKSSAMQLGKALNDPIAGVSALRKVGVSLTDAQEAQIKTLVKSGRTMEAQKIILAELKTEFGGSAKAAGETFAGKMDILSNSFNEFMQVVGEMILPLLEQLQQFMSSVVDGLKNADPAVVEAGVVVAGLAAAIGPLLIALGAVGTVIAAIASPIGLVVLAVAGIGAAFATNFLGIQDVVKNAYSYIEGPINDIINLVKDFWSKLTNPGGQRDDKMHAKGMIPQGPDSDSIQKMTKSPGSTNTTSVPFLDTLVNALGEYLPKLIAGVGTLLSGVVSWMATEGPKLIGDIWSTLLKVGETVLPALSSSLSSLFTGVVSWVGTDGMKLLGTVWETLLNVGANILPKITGGLSSLFSGVVTWMSTEGIKLIGDIWGTLLKVDITIFDALKTTFTNFFAEGGGFSTLLGTLKGVVTSGLAGVLGVDATTVNLWFKAITDWFNNAFVGENSVLGKAVAEGKNWIKQFIDKVGEIKDGIVQAFSGVVDTLTAPFRDVIRFIGNMLIKAGEMGGMFSNLKATGQSLVAAAGMPMKAMGGTVIGGNPVLVGERGPEIYVPGGTGTILPNSSFYGSSGGGGGNIINMTLNGINDPGTIWRAVINEARRRNIQLEGA